LILKLSRKIIATIFLCQRKNILTNTFSCALWHSSANLDMSEVEGSN